jgi:hypothetical protein
LELLVGDVLKADLPYFDVCVRRLFKLFLHSWGFGSTFTVHFPRPWCSCTRFPPRFSTVPIA